MTQASADEPTWWAVCLCAGWCGVCREWQPAFATEARARPGVRFAWIDVEDDADAMGDFDIDTFPTLLVALGAEVLFLGPIAPSAAQFGRLLDTLGERPEASPSLPAAAQELFDRLQPLVRHRTQV